MFWVQSDHLSLLLPSVAEVVVGVSGAGDTVVAALAVGLLSGLPIKNTIFRANIVAGLAVGRLGTAVV